MTITKIPKPEWAEKAWGRTRCLHRGPNFEVWEIEAKKGFRCSRHTHRKWNSFHVLKGQLNVELFDKGEGGLLFSGGNKLEAGDEFRVAPETWHCFATPGDDCHALEIYWTVDIDPNDIARADEGGAL